MNRDNEHVGINDSLNQLIHWETWKNKLEVVIIKLESHWGSRCLVLFAFILKEYSSISEYIHSVIIENWVFW
jgi:hypothetical protein